MADQEAGVYRNVALERVEIVGKASPVPRATLAQAVQRHALDTGEHVHEILAAIVGERGNAETAVAANDRGHPVDGRGCQSAVPEYLGVVVGVYVNEAGGHDQSVGIDGPGRAVIHLTDRDHPPAGDTDIGAFAGHARAIDHRAPAYYEIEHAASCFPGRRQSNRPDSPWPHHFFRKHLRLVQHLKNKPIVAVPNP